MRKKETSVVANENRKKKRTNIGKNPIWTGFDSERIFLCFFFQFGLAVREDDSKWWWHCMAFLEHQYFSASSIRSLAHWFYFFFLSGINSVFVCTFNIEIAFFDFRLPITHHLCLSIHAGYCSRGPLPWRANIFIKPLECSINFCVNNGEPYCALQLCERFFFWFGVDRQPIVVGDCFSLMRIEWIWHGGGSRSQ